MNNLFWYCGLIDANKYIHLTKCNLYFSWWRFLTILFLCITGGAKGGSKEPQSPAKKYSSLRKKCVEATAILFCGLNAVKASYLDISKLQEGCLNQGLLKPQHFIGKIILIKFSNLYILESIQDLNFQFGPSINYVVSKSAILI